MIPAMSPLIPELRGGNAATRAALPTPPGPVASIRPAPPATPDARRRQRLAPVMAAGALAAALGSAAPAAVAADVDADAEALSLTSAPAEATTAAQEKGAADNRLFVEGALGVGSPRDGSGKHSLRRASVDFIHAGSFAPGWRAVLSDRLDYVRPRDLRNVRSDGTVNSLREAYLSWQPADGNTAVDLGRMNLRNGPAYGYNPTDFFRDDSLRVVTTTNPLSLRENRLGTVVLRGQRLWNGGSVSLALSPKLASSPSSAGESLDLGATNRRNRGLIVLGNQWSDRISSQLLVYKESAARAQIGASLTALVGDATVAFVEASRGREPDLASRALGLPAAPASRNRIAAGATYTFASKLSLTGEYEYNGFAVGRDQWNAIGAASATALGAYLLEAQRRQDLASRQAWLVYATQKDLFVKNLDLTALLRIDAGDSSRLAWLELRQHWAKVDLALQLQQQSGRFGTEYWLYPDRRSVQLLASYFF